MREARGPAWTDWLARARDRRAVGPRHAQSRPQAARRGRDARRGRPRGTSRSRKRCRGPRAAVDGRARARRRRLDDRAVRVLRSGDVRVAVVDYGVSGRSSARLAAAGAAVTVYPHDVDADELARHDGVLLANGPGDPEPLVDEVATVRDLLGRVPMLGICLGHQLLALASGDEDVQAAVRPSRREPSGARARDGPRARDDAEPRLRGRAVARSARRRTSRSTTAPSRASTFRASTRARRSSIPRPAPDRTTRGRSSREFVEELRAAA